MRGILILLIILAVPLCTIGQDSIRLEQYKKGFKFKRGLYLTFSDFKNNTPIPPERVSDVKDFSGGIDYAQLLLNKGIIAYQNEDGIWVEVSSRSVWGYSNGINIYMNPNVRIGIIGSISHISVFAASSGASVFGNRFSVTIISRDDLQEEVYQFILDFETGELMTFKRKNLEKLIQRDEELWDKYNNFKGKKKEKLYLFLNKYNERNPIYFPVEEETE